MAWVSNMYTMSAVSVAIGRAFGKKSKAKYIKKPFFQTEQDEKQINRLSEEQKKRERNNLLMQLQIMQINYESKQKSNG